MDYHETIPEFICPISIEASPLLEQLKHQLDPGEAEGIVLAKQLKANLLLIDETLGREAARQEHLPVIGLMGVLLVAKKKDFIASISDLIEQLESKAGFYLSLQVKARVLEAAGE